MLIKSRQKAPKGKVIKTSQIVRLKKDIEVNMAMNLRIDESRKNNLFKYYSFFFTITEAVGCHYFQELMRFQIVSYYLYMFMGFYFLKNNQRYIVYS